MASLTEVYEGGEGAGLRRLYAGVALFGVGAALVIAGIVVASTDVGSYFGLGLYEAREVAGVLGGVGFPAVLVGTMTVLPRASRRIRLTAAVGAAVCLLGVAMFRLWYPVDWMGGSGDTTMTLVVAGTYFAGAILTTWSLFTAVANFKARNDPGGTVTLEVTRGGETRVVEVSNDDLRGTLGGIGLLGGTPDGDVETQTNRPPDARREPDHDGGDATDPESRAPDAPSRSRSARGGVTGFDSSPGVTDGGAADTEGLSEPGSGPGLATPDDAEFIEDDSPSVRDAYCGNCAHFRYVRTDDGLLPYCGFHGETMDDMDACEEWTSNA